MGTTRWDYRHTVILLCTVAFFATMVARLVISPVVPDIRAWFGVSTGAVGLALSGMWAAYALAQLPSGVLADRLGERRVILGAVAATGTASLLLAMVPSYVAFLVLAIVLGGAAGMVYTAATSLVTKSAAGTGRAIGAYISGGPLAGLVAPPIAVAIGAQYDWRAAVALGAVAAIPALALFAWRVEPTPAARPDLPVSESLEVARLHDVLRRPTIGTALVLAVLGAFTWQATASFLPTFLEDYRGLSRSSAGLLFSAYFLVHGLSQPVTGTLSDVLTRSSAAGLTMGSGVIGYGLLVVGTSTWSAVVAVFFVGLAMSWGAPVQSMFMDALIDEERGTGFGLVRTIYMLLGALGSVVIGAVADLAGWDVAFGVLAGLMATAVLVAAIDRVR